MTNMMLTHNEWQNVFERALGCYMQDTMSITMLHAASSRGLRTQRRC